MGTQEHDKAEEDGGEPVASSTDDEQNGEGVTPLLSHILLQPPTTDTIVIQGTAAETQTALGSALLQPPAVELPVVRDVAKGEQDLEAGYYKRMEQAEMVRGTMAQMQKRYEELRVQLEFRERLMKGQDECYLSRDDAIGAIFGTTSMGWADLIPQVPYTETSKPKFRGARPRPTDNWYKLVCWMGVMGPLVPTLMALIWAYKEVSYSPGYTHFDATDIVQAILGAITSLF